MDFPFSRVTILKKKYAHTFGNPDLIKRWNTIGNLKYVNNSSLMLAKCNCCINMIKLMQNVILNVCPFDYTAVAVSGKVERS